jgi:Tol biopolymer transport system component
MVQQNPLIIYSEFTADNVRLMATDFHHKHFKLLDREGTYVGACWSSHGKEMIYGGSGKIWHCMYDAGQKKWISRVLFYEKEPCSSPCLINNLVVYCCGGKIKLYNPLKKTTEIITPEGYCVAPACCEVNQKIIYSRKIQGYMQLFIYDFKSKKHQQLTFDKAHKTDATWSPCGTFLACCYDQDKAVSIAIINVITGKISLITAPDKYCGYPSWSPAFDFYLEIM